MCRHPFSMSMQYACGVLSTCVSGGSDGALFCSHLCWCCSLLVQVRGNFCLRKFNVVGAIVQLSLIASTLVIVGCACILSFLLALSIPYIVAGAVIKSAFVQYLDLSDFLGGRRQAVTNLYVTKPWFLISNNAKQLPKTFDSKLLTAT